MGEPATTAQAERAARNQALFRAVNERITQINDAFDAILPLGDWVCECAHEECSARLQLTHEEYEAVRQDGATFVVLPSEEHVVPQVENVIERHERYWVVEKIGAAAKHLEQQGPRP